MTTDDDARDLLGAYAVDAVDDVERRAVERLLARDPEAAREVDGLRAAAAMLGSAAATPPPAGLRADVLAAIAGVPQQGVAPVTAPADADADAAAERGPLPAPDATAGGDPGTGPDLPTGPDLRAEALATAADESDLARGTAAPVPVVAPAVPIASARSARVPRRATTWLAVAATALGAAVVPSVLAVQQARQADRAEQQAQAVTDLLADPDATVVRADVVGGGTAVGVLTDDRALFTAAGLTEPDDDRAYQLWVLRDGEPLSVGVLDDEDGSVRALADDYRAGDGLAVTVEPAGGSPAPTSDPVVVLLPTEA